MNKTSKTEIAYDDIIATMRDMVDIFSASQDKLRADLTASQDRLRVELTEEIRATRYESKMANEELRDELRSFKYEMKDFRTETNATLKQHGVYFENIQQDIILFGGLEARVSRLEKAHS